MKILVDIGHPAHVHFFKNAVWQLEARGHKVQITTRNKEITLDLLNAYQLNYCKVGDNKKGLANKATNMIKIDSEVYKIAKKFNPDILTGIHSPYIAQIGKLLNRPSLVFTDTEHAKLANVLTFPFASAIITPSSFKGDLGPKHIRYSGFHELAYLHPNYFRPNPAVLEEMALSEDDNIFLVRFASFNASHDTKSENFKKEYISSLIEKLDEKGKIIISSEKKLDTNLEKYQYNLSPSKYHDVLFYAKMYIGESSTSAEEAAVLGTPAFNFERILINGTACSFGDICGLLTELENKYEMVYCFHDEVKLLRKLDELLDRGIENVKQDWKEKNQRLLKDKIDVTQFIIWFIENYPKSFRDMKEDCQVVQDHFKTGV
jgi:uncharacterized protein